MHHQFNIALLCLVLVTLCDNMAEGGDRPRQYLRSRLARSLYDRMVTDEQLRHMDLSALYRVDELALSDEMRLKFIEFCVDEDTQDFVTACLEQADWVFTHVWHSLAKSFLGFFMTQTSINGLLDRGRMFVWSKRQALALLRSQPPHQRSGSFGSLSPAELESPRGFGHDDTAGGSLAGLDPPRPFGWAPPTEADARVELGGMFDENEDHPQIIWEHMLDLGAGDGYVTQILASHARHVHVTEASAIMRRRLRGRGYTVLDTWNWAEEQPDVLYDVISCLNLLDRCDTPRSLLATIRSKMAPDGTLVVALVLPFTPYVEFGSSDHLPSEDLGYTGSTIEEQVVSLGQDVFPSLGLHVQSWTRLPYLCEGDLDQAFYWLSDIIFVLRREEAAGPNVATAGSVSGPAMKEEAFLQSRETQETFETFHDTVEDFENKNEL